MTADLLPLDAAALQAEAGGSWRVEVVADGASAICTTGACCRLRHSARTWLLLSARPAIFTSSIMPRSVAPV